MMPRPLLFRLAAGAIALWLALVLADAPALHPCPMHDVPAAGGPVLAHAMAGMGSMGPHGGAGAAPGSSPGHAPGSSPAHAPGCTCLGACGPGAAVLLAPAPPAVAAIPIATAPAQLPPWARPLRRATSHFLPFAHAPPPLA